MLFLDPVVAPRAGGVVGGGGALNHPVFIAPSAGLALAALPDCILPGNWAIQLEAEALASEFNSESLMRTPA